MYHPIYREWTMQSIQIPRYKQLTCANDQLLLTIILHVTLRHEAPTKFYHTV